MLLHSTMTLFLSSVAAFSPSGEGPCYYIDGSIDTGSSACYLLDSVGASMCCRGFEQCIGSGLCLSTPTGRIGQYDNDTAIRRRSCTDYSWQDGACLAIAPFKYSSPVQLSRCADASYCPRSPDNVNETCCENNQGTMAGLDQALIAARVVSSIRAALSSTTTTSPPSSAAPTVSRTVTPEPPRLSSTPDPTAPASSTSNSGGLSQESKVGLGVGLPTLGITALGAFVGWLRMKQKQKQKQREQLHMQNFPPLRYQFTSVV
ncbi:hypothetical protein XANCAGTX0491_005064 [Xanthoria calcicola]